MNKYYSKKSKHMFDSREEQKQVVTIIILQNINLCKYQQMYKEQ